MLIGTDVSLRECRDSGYLMMKYDGRIKFTYTTDVKFIKYLPDYIRKEGGLTLEQSFVSTILDTECIWDTYEVHKYSIDSFADCNYKSIHDIKGWYDLLHLADVVDAYVGIFT